MSEELSKLKVELEVAKQKNAQATLAYDTNKFTSTPEVRAIYLDDMTRTALEVKEIEAKIDKKEAEIKLAKAESDLQLEAAKVPPNEVALKVATEAVGFAREYLKNLSGTGVQDSLDSVSQPFTSSRLVESVLSLNFVKSATYFQTLKRVVDGLNATAMRDMVFPVISGLMGAGKSRLGAQVCDDVKAEDVLIGYIPLAGDLKAFKDHKDADPKDNEKCKQVVADALVMALLHGYGGHPKIDNVITKLRQDLRRPAPAVVKVVLHIDEYQSNVPLMNMLLRGCALVYTRQLIVVPILTGLRPVQDVQRFGEDSRYSLVHLHVSLLVGEEKLDDKIIPVGQQAEDAFFDYISVKTDMGRNCANLLNLISDCGGHPASLQALGSILKGSEYLSVLNKIRTEGLLEQPQAEGIYASLVAKVADKYNENRWARASSSSLTASRLSDRSVQLFSRIVLYTVVEVDVERKDRIVESIEATYGDLEGQGLISLKPSVVEPKFNIVLPLLALSWLNNLLHVIKGGVLQNPYVAGFDMHERLAVASLSAKLRALRILKGPNSSCSLTELRPGALLKGVGESLVINLPEDSNVEYVMDLFDKATDLRQKVDLHSNVLSNSSASSVDGTCLLAAPNEEAVDHVAVLSGTWKGKPCTIFWSGQSKMKASIKSGSKVQRGVVNTLVEKMAKVEDRVIKNWLTGRVKPIVVVYDLFTDRDAGGELGRAEFKFPKGGCEKVALIVTTSDSIEKSVGKILGLRSNRKRPAESVAEGKAKVKR